MTMVMKKLSGLHKNYEPPYFKIQEFLKTADKDIAFVAERNGGYNYRFDFKISGNLGESYFYCERLVKTVLWVAGGFKIYVAGSPEISKRLQRDYAPGGVREFDSAFMSRVYEKPFEIVACGFDELPDKKEGSLSAGGNTDGCRIGFDAGGSDRKVSAVVDGKEVYSEETIWFPKLNSDPDYHYSEIVKAFKTAASKMPRVDAIGVSSAGIYVDNRAMAASLFIKVGAEDFDKKIKDIYINAAKEIGDVPLEVANDGDVTALAGAVQTGGNKILGIAMGTSEAGGYVNDKGGLNGWLNELAFAPCDFGGGAAVDEWSGDKGCGCKYFSQDAVIRLAADAGIDLDESLSLAEKLKAVQELMKAGDSRVHEIYRTIGIYLGYTIPYYAMFYDLRYVLVLGRVLSGEGGNLIVQTAQEILDSEFPNLGISIVTPDEKFKRLGQSIVAAGLPQIKK